MANFISTFKFYSKKKKDLICVVPENNIESDVESSSDDDFETTRPLNKTCNQKKLLIPVEEADLSDPDSEDSSLRWGQSKTGEKSNIVIPPTPPEESPKGKEVKLETVKFVRTRRTAVTTTTQSKVPVRSLRQHNYHIDVPKSKIETTPSKRARILVGAAKAQLLTSPNNSATRSSDPNFGASSKSNSLSVRRRLSIDSPKKAASKPAQAIQSSKGSNLQVNNENLRTFIGSPKKPASTTAMPKSTKCDNLQLNKDNLQIVSKTYNTRQTTEAPLKKIWLWPSARSEQKKGLTKDRPMETVSPEISKEKAEKLVKLDKNSNEIIHGAPLSSKHGILTPRNHQVSLSRNGENRLNVISSPFNVKLCSPKAIEVKELNKPHVQASNPTSERGMSSPLNPEVTLPSPGFTPIQSGDQSLHRRSSPALSTSPDLFHSFSDDGVSELASPLKSFRSDRSGHSHESDNVHDSSIRGSNKRSSLSDHSGKKDSSNLLIDIDSDKGSCKSSPFKGNHPESPQLTQNGLDGAPRSSSSLPLPDNSHSSAHSDASGLYSDVPLALRMQSWLEGDIKEHQYEDRQPLSVPGEIKTPIEYFRYFFDKDLINLIVEQSNIYSMQKDGTDINITFQDIESFIGILIFMGVCSLPAIEDYWNPRTRIPQVADIMSYRRFLQIRTRIHFSNNLENELDPDRFKKVRPLLNDIRRKCQLIEHDYDFSIDETMVAYKGTRAGNLRQYMPDKPSAKWGFKFFVLSDVNGLVYDFIPYCGPQTFTQENLSEEEKSLGVGAMAVVSLCKNLPSPELSTVTFDNFYTGIPLMTYLKNEMKILSLGTVRRNRMGGCEFSSDKDLMKQGRGICESKKNKDDLVVIKWMDNKAVHIASTAAGVKPKGTVLRYDKTAKGKINIPCPRAIINYNKSMGGVDLNDMLMSLYKCPTRSRRWYFPIIGYMIDLCITNAWLIYKRDCRLLPSGIEKKVTSKGKTLKTTTEIKHSKEFHLYVSGSLCAPTKREKGRPSLDNSKSKNPRRSLIPRPIDDLRLDLYDHLPDFSTKGRCRFCPNGFTRSFCPKCKCRLCYVDGKNCFRQFHLKKNLDTT